MRNIIVLLMLGSALAGISASQSPATDAPLSITIEAQKDAITVGSPAEFKVRLKNNSPRDINASSTWINGVNVAYGYDVRGSDGKPVRVKQTTDPVRGHVKLYTLRPGEEKWEDIELPSEYFTRPGEYVIQFSRNVSNNPTEGHAKSNKVTLTVTQ
jgi:hypothetical protein